MFYYSSQTHFLQGIENWQTVYADIQAMFVPLQGSQKILAFSTNANLATGEEFGPWLKIFPHDLEAWEIGQLYGGN